MIEFNCRPNFAANNPNRFIQHQCLRAQNEIFQRTEIRLRESASILKRDSCRVFLTPGEYYKLQSSIKTLPQIIFESLENEMKTFGVSKVGYSSGDRQP